MLYEGSWFRAQETSFVHLFFHLVSSVKPDKHFVGGSTVKTKMSVRFLAVRPLSERSGSVPLSRTAKEPVSVSIHARFRM